MVKEEKKNIFKDNHKDYNNMCYKKNNKKTKKTLKKEETPPFTVKKMQSEQFVKKFKAFRDNYSTGQEPQNKPGQKYPEPSLNDPIRIFYETLYFQNEKSLMAQKYCLEYGLLPENIAQKLLTKTKKTKS